MSDTEYGVPGEKLLTSEEIGRLRDECDDITNRPPEGREHWDARRMVATLCELKDENITLKRQLDSYPTCGRCGGKRTINRTSLWGFNVTERCPYCTKEGYEVSN